MANANQVLEAFDKELVGALFAVELGHVDVLEGALEQDGFPTLPLEDLPDEGFARLTA